MKRTQRQLKKQLEEQKSLEEELEKLQTAADPKESCKEVVKFIQSSSTDPMPDTENNPFAVNCFVAGTEILVSKSGKHKKIEEMQVGDEIVCLVPRSNKMFDIENIPSQLCENSKVTAIHRSFTNYICCIGYRNIDTNENRTVWCTDSHPIYVNNQGWTTVSGKSNGSENYDFNISKLKIDDQVCLETGQFALISQIHLQYSRVPVAVYNLTASNGHTFFANGLFVHNKGLCDNCIIL